MRRQHRKLGALTSNPDLDKFRYVFREKQDGVKLSVYDGRKLVGVVGAITSGYCYPEGSSLTKYRKHANVVSAEIVEEYRGRKLYQEMLLRLREYAKKELGCSGLRSDGFQRSSMATRAWKKLNPRVEVRDSFGRENLFLDGLPEAREVAKNLGVTLDLYGGRDKWALSRIVVPKDARGGGAGSKVMAAVVAEADKDGATVTLTPSTDFGASSKARLVAFYKRFGFVENKGRNKDFSISDTMYRLPKTRALGGVIYRLRAGSGETVTPHDTGVETDVLWEGTSLKEAQNESRRWVESGGVREVELWSFYPLDPFTPDMSEKKWFRGPRKTIYTRKEGGGSTSRKSRPLGAFDPKAHPKNLQQVNKHLREIGLPVRAIAGDGYYYFVDANDNPVEGASVYIYRASQQPFSFWESDARDAAKLAIEEEKSRNEYPDRTSFKIHRPKFDGLEAVRVKKAKIPSWVTSTDGLMLLAAYDGKREVGRVHGVEGRDSVRVSWIEVADDYRRKHVATRLYEAAAKYACSKGKPLASDEDGNRAPGAEAFWQKQSAKGRAEHRGNKFFLTCPPPASLDGLPKKGRISLATAKRAMARLPAKVRACGFTVSQLREGMEIEREHRDVTKGGVLKTAKIAAAHLCEFPRGGYYPGLKKLERKLKRKK